MADVTAPGRELHRRFEVLGDLTGKTEREIQDATCSPTSIASMAHGNRLLQWQATGYHIAILFGPDHRFLKVSSEYANHPAPPEVDYLAGLIALGAIVAVAVVLVILNHT
jgi:hypothetical protein